MRRWLLAVTTLANAAPAVSAVEPVANAAARRQLSLDGAWRAIVDPSMPGASTRPGC